MTHKRKHVEFKIKYFNSLNFLPKRMKTNKQINKNYRKAFATLLFDSELVNRYGREF